MNIYKIITRSYEGCEIIYFSHENLYSFEDLKNIFTECINISKGNYKSDCEKLNIKINIEEKDVSAFVNGAIEEIKLLGFEIYEPETKTTLDLFIDTEVLNINKI